MTDAQSSPVSATQPSAGVDAAPGRPFMLFRVGSRWLAIEAQRVVEVVVKGSITRIPTAPRHVLGITSLRGGLVPVVSLAQLMESTGTMSTDTGAITPRLVVVATPEYEMALVVHEVGGFVNREPIRAEPASTRRMAFLPDQIAWDGHTVDIVNVAALATAATENSAYGD